MTINLSAAKALALPVALVLTLAACANTMAQEPGAPAVDDDGMSSFGTPTDAQVAPPLSQ